MKMFPVPCFNRIEKIEKEDNIPNYKGDYSITISGRVDEYGNVEYFKPFDNNIQTEYVCDETITNYSYYSTNAIDSANWAE